MGSCDGGVPTCNVDRERASVKLSRVWVWCVLGKKEKEEVTRVGVAVTASSVCGSVVGRCRCGKAASAGRKGGIVGKATIWLGQDALNRRTIYDLAWARYRDLGYAAVLECVRGRRARWLLRKPACPPIGRGYSRVDDTTVHSRFIRLHGSSY